MNFGETVPDFGASFTYLGDLCPIMGQASLVLGHPLAFWGIFQGFWGIFPVLRGQHRGTPCPGIFWGFLESRDSRESRGLPGPPAAPQRELLSQILAFSGNFGKNSAGARAGGGA